MNSKERKELRLKFRGMIENVRSFEVLARRWWRQQTDMEPPHADYWKWEERQTRSLASSASAWTFGVCTLIMSIFIYNIPEQTSLMKFLYMYVLLVFTVGAIIMATWSSIANTTPTSLQRFLSDLDDLFRQIASSTSPDNLVSRAEENLVDMAVSIIRAQNANQLQHEEDLRELFKVAHRCFQKFGLVDDVWNNYFAEAREKIKAEAAVPAELVETVAPAGPEVPA